MSRPPYSIVEYFYPPESEGHRCGYCKSPNTNYSHGMWAHSITPENYEHLINLGWRRSGKYMYKPMNEKVCCPMYTIRNLSTSVEVSRSQRKVLKRFKRYVIDGVNKKEQDKHMEVDGEEHSHENHVVPLPKSQPEIAPPPQPMDGNDTSIKVKKDNPQQPHQVSSREPPPPKKQHPLKKKYLRRERKRQKLIARGENPEEFFKTNERNRVAELEHYFKHEESNHLHFKTKLVKVNSKEFAKVFEAEHKLYQKYQMHTHGDTEHECRSSQFKRFLCDNPFKNGDDDTPQPQGTYHQHYYLNNTLFAVGVLDILPHCVSSVYFFYDPDHSFLSPGTLGALHEMSFVNQLNKQYGTIKYYYLGFYIHTCVKMRYKRKFRPCELVCPVTYEWVPFDDRVSKILDTEKYGVLKEGGGKGMEAEDIETILIMYDGAIHSYSTYPERASEQELLQSYVNLVSGRVASSMLLYRSSS